MWLLDGNTAVANKKAWMPDDNSHLSEEPGGKRQLACKRCNKPGGPYESIEAARDSELQQNFEGELARSEVTLHNDDGREATEAAKEVAGPTREHGTLLTLLSFLEQEENK